MRFVCGTDRPMVPFGVARDLFVGPIDRWYFIVHLWGRSTDSPVLQTSPPSLV